MSTWGVLGVVALSIVVIMITTWLLSVIVHNASIVDIIWGLGFVATAWAAWISTGADGVRSGLLLIMVTVWGLRLSGYLAWRNHGADEDFRYRAMRQKIGPQFWLVSLLTVFATQGLLMFVVALPLPLGMAQKNQSFDIASIVGLALWLTGLVVETVGDAQLARFKARHDSKDQVMDRGLWRYTRHPNYFGDFCVWWGIFIVSVRSWPSAVAVIGPLTMSVLLMRVSGVVLLEKSLTKRRAGYAEYVARTSAFFPLPPRQQ